jgi:Arc/MetJ-type ribon-helix-helix transcriptional regulator
MTIQLPDDLTSSVRAAVLSGQFASAEDVVVAAVRDYLRRQQEQARQTDDAAAGPHVPAAEEPSGQELQRRLLAAGVISEIKPPITDLTPYRNRQAVPIQGEPLSATVIRERR